MEASARDEYERQNLRNSNILLHADVHSTLERTNPNKKEKGGSREEQNTEDYVAFPFNKFGFIQYEGHETQTRKEMSRLDRLERDYFR